MPAYRPTELYDWAADLPLVEQQPAQLPVYAPAPVPQIPPNVRVMAVPGQQPYYAYQPAPPPPYDPLPQRMMGCGVMAFGILAGAGVAEAGSYLLFAGMALATHALIGVAAIFVSGAIALVVVRSTGGVRISNFHQGDNSSFRAGR
jgi:hypothetical protein